MFIEVKNNVLKSWANYCFSDKDIEASQDRTFENGYKLENNQIVQLPQPKTYIEKRIEAYPSLAEQLDMIYWDKVNNTNLWQTKIAEIKAKYPKE